MLIEVNVVCLINVVQLISNMGIMCKGNSACISFTLCENLKYDDFGAY